MELGDLDGALAVGDGSLTLSGATLPGVGLDAVLTAFNDGSPLVVEGAEKKAGAGTIAVTGTTTFANVGGAALSGLFSLDGAGNPQALLRMAMPEGWTFSRSFPDPTEGGAARAQLDSLQLTNAALIFASQAGADAPGASGAPLAAGLNVVATLRLEAVAALVDAALGGGATATLHATVTPPAAAAPPSLPYGGSPWDALGWTVPGIAAEAELGIDLELGEAELADVRLRFYSPPSSAWLESNRSYGPRQGLAGRLTLESAGIDAELSGELSPSASSAQVSAAIAGATFGKLEDLAGLAPGHSLASQLPEEVQQALAAVEGLTITQAFVAFSGGLSPSAVSQLGFMVGFPGSGWTVFPGLEAQISSVQFVVTQPFGAGGDVSATLGGTLKVGGQPLEVTTELPHLVVRADLPTANTVTTADFTRDRAPELTLPDLSIDELSVYVEPGASWTVEAAMADDPPWELDLGAGGLTIADVAMDMSKQASGDAQGTLMGLLMLDDELAVAAEYDVPGGLMVRAQLPDLDLSRLVSLFDEAGIVLPKGFDPSLVGPYVLVDTDENGERLTAATKVAGLGTLAFTAQRQDGKTGVAVGVELDGAASTVPGLGALAKIESLVGLTELMLVVSSLDRPGFQLPAMSSFGAAALPGAQQGLPPQAGGLVRGLNVYARLSAASSPGLQAIAGWLGIDVDGTLGVTIGVSLPDPATDSKLFLAVSTTVDGVSVQGDLGLLMQGGEPGAFLDAVVRATVQSQPVAFGVGATELPDGVLVEGSMKGSLTFGPVTVSDLAIVVGMDLEGVPSLGLAGTFDVPGVSFDGSLAIFLDSEDPAKSLLAGSVSELTLASVAQALAPGAPIPATVAGALSRIGLKGLPAFTMPATAAAALDGRDLAAISAAFQQHGATALPSTSDRVLLVVSEAGRQWRLTDLTTMTHYTLLAGGDGVDVSLDAQVYIAPQQVRLGDPVSGIVFPQGLHVEGVVDLLVAEVRVKVEAGPPGIAVDVEADPIELAGGALLKITDATGSAGPRLSLSTYAQPQRPPPFDQPHFLLSGRIDVLGLEVASVEIEVDSTGLLVEVSGAVAPGVTVALKGVVASADEMLLSGGATVGIDTTIDLGDLGRLPLDDEVGGTVTVKLAAGAPSASFAGTLVFQGVSVDVPNLDVPIETGALTRLGDLVEDELEAVMKELLSDAERWFEWVQRGVVQGIADAAGIARVLGEEFGQGEAEIVTTMREAGYAADAVAAALHDGLGKEADEIASALDDAGYSLTETAAAVQGAFSLSVGELAGVLQSIGASLPTVTGVLGALGSDVDEIGAGVEEVFGKATAALDPSNWWP